MKPYLVEYTFKAVVVADDESHAWAVARSNQREAFGDTFAADIFVETEVAAQSDLQDSEWDLQCIPYGGDGSKRISDYLTKEAA